MTAVCPLLTQHAAAAAHVTRGCGVQVLEPDAGLQSTLQASLALRDCADASAAGVPRPCHFMRYMCLQHVAHSEGTSILLLQEVSGL